MNVDRAVLTLAGSLILLSAVLTYWVSPLWVLLGVFVGLNMLQAAFTGWCLSAKVFRRLGLPPGPAFR